MSSYWRSLVVFLVANTGIVCLYFCYRRGQRQLEAEQERIADARIAEAIRNRQQLVPSGSAGQTSQERKERLAHLLVSGVSSETTLVLHCIIVSLTDSFALSPTHTTDCIANVA
jgi:hypothetical protein